ncbi:ribonuclease P protein component [bacterium]|nr:ribonuclease P protein component [bacterium]
MPKEASFSKVERITTKKEYQAVFEKGRRINGPFMKILCSSGEKDRKIGIIISRRIKGSVKRARYKRLLREAYRRNKNMIPFDMKIVVVVFKDIRDDNYACVTQALLAMIKRAGVE